MVRLRTDVTAFAACIALIGCTSTPDYFLAEGTGGADHGSVLLLPLNVDGQLPHYVSDSTELLDETIVAYLEQHKKQVMRISFSKIRAPWSAAVQGAKARRNEQAVSPETLPLARQLLAKRLASDAGADAVIFRSVVERAAPYRGLVVKWDGVKRRQEVNWNGPKTLQAQRMNGDARALSLAINIHSSTGEPIFSRQAGLELSQIVKVVDWRYEMEFRGDLLTDSDVLQESVGLAFEPYLVRPPE